MIDDDKREYRQDFALAVLKRAGKGCTASDVAEHIAVLGLAEGHPAALWKSCSPVTISGVLRTLETRNQVSKLESGTRNNRAGRSEPTWRPVGGYDAVAPLPLPPEPQPNPDQLATARVIAPDASAYAAMNRLQLNAVLEYSDDLMSSVARFIRDVQDINARARRALQDVGYEVGA